MNQELPPTLDPRAAQRWAAWSRRELSSPWLHEEVARRMAERLSLIVHKPATWLHWAPLQGGLEAHARLVQAHPQSRCYLYEPEPTQARHLEDALSPRWWSPARLRPSAPRFGLPEQPVEMLWSNMGLHMLADPLACIRQWHSQLGTQGVLMFSCLGPDSLRELRALYAKHGWGEVGHEFTDMHDWGDMLVSAGFAEPVMDMERITLSFSSPEKLLQELRGLGRNLHRQRQTTTRATGWLRALHQALARELAGADGRLELSFEIVYGHAVKPLPRPKVASESAISLQDMRAALTASRRSG
jgi:malonyl-CoA O-methyltransferase